MRIVTMHQARLTLSRLVSDLEQGRVREVALTRNGRTVAKLVPVTPTGGQRLGVAKGKFEVPDSVDEANEEVRRLVEHGPGHA